MISSTRRFILTVVLVIVGLQVGLMLALKSPAGDVERDRIRKAVRAEYDQSGLLRRIDYDTNRNGTFDTFTFTRGGEVRRVEIDHDEDGRVDRWEYFVNGARIPRTGFSAANDGIASLWVYRGVDAGSFRVERSSKGDGVIDTWEWFENGECVRLETDADGDGRPDGGHEEGWFDASPQPPDAGGARANSIIQ